MKSEDEILKDIFDAKRLGKPVDPLFEELQQQRRSKRSLIEPQPTNDDFISFLSLLLYPMFILLGISILGTIWWML